MLALGETHLLLAIVMIVVLVSLATWNLMRVFQARAKTTTLLLASLLTIIGGFGTVSVVVEGFQEWPPNTYIIVSFGFWQLVFFAGTLGLMRIRTKAKKP